MHPLRRSRPRGVRGSHQPYPPSLATTPGGAPRHGLASVEVVHYGAPFNASHQGTSLMAPNVSGVNTS